MSKHWRIAFILAVAACLLISACGGNSSATTSTSTPASGSTSASTPGSSASNAGGFNCVSGSITASGSTALQPYVDAVAKKYQEKCSGARITVQPGGSKKGLADAENGTSQIGNSDVPAATNQTDLVDHQVAIVIFTLIVNPNVKVNDIKTSDVQGIYTGKITNWKQVGGPDLPITVISRPTTSGTRATFKKFMLDNNNESPAQAKNLTVDSTGTVIQTVSQTAGAIGYAALGDAEKASSSLAILKIDGQEPTAANVTSNAYKFWNIEHMYTKGQPSGLAQAFLDYMVSSDATTIAESLKFVPTNTVPENIRTTHNK
ncbi:phosphate ABC transporter substrate-binding protein [Ktedonosporobacter rubrisoli]|uniref:Phosphate-binding protein n=1 Tax=Ktedonosporobacter rubrisoli TaxID=2509675 RepID=A0A4P6JWE6_KTERU|nr:phosphate ABC transporter substrate-binding protein [Ktedonosporobacter rubrisoli]QBD80018.1 phosphate ABC transporter substrate-binding protein [Ktedonosporobacter rubrisoli]